MIDDRRLAGEYVAGPLTAKPRTVRDLVEHPPLRARRDTSLRDAAARMAADRADAVCVTTPTDDLIGIATTSDLVHALAGRPLAHGDANDAPVTPLLFRLTPVLPTAD
nr:CBS domain-containing protein [Pseudofrankia asymbiotica]